MNIFAKSSQKEKKELTPSQQKVRTILNWVVNVICIVLIVFALVVAIFTIIRSANPDNITRVGDNCYFSVASDSMAPTFKKNDVIISTAYSGDGADLKVGQVITFKFLRYQAGSNYPDFNSHRVVGIEKNAAGTVTAIRTRGDNQEGRWQDTVAEDADHSSWDKHKVSPEDIVAVWGDVSEGENGELIFTSGKMLKGAGALGNFMQDPVEGKTRFFCIVVLPLILLFVIYAFILVRTLVIAKLENNKKVAGEQVVTVDSLSDEEKRRLAEEYLASLSREKQESEAQAEQTLIPAGSDKEEISETAEPEEESSAPDETEE